MPAAYPTSLANFLVYQDQPGDLNHLTVDGIDLTIDSAHATNQIHDEIIAIEQTIGVRPFTTPGQTTIGASVIYLYKNKAGLGHGHYHGILHNLKSDDHHQYVPVNGSRGFTAPVTSPAAVGAQQLMNLGQIQGKGVTAAQMQNLVNAGLDPNIIRGPHPGQTLRIQGGQTWGYSDENGNLYVPFNPPFAALMSFVYMKLPYPGQSMLGWYQYQYVEDQLILISLDNRGALVQFIEDIRVDARALVAIAWTALGV